MALRFFAAASAALIATTALASPASARDHAKLGKGDYFLQVAPLIGDDGSVTSREMTTGQFDFVMKLDNLCRVDAKKYEPSEFKTVALTLIRNVPGAALGTAGGAALGNFTGAVSAFDYGKYGAGSVAGSSFGAGFTAQAYGKKGFMGSCMTNMLAEVRNQGKGYFIRGIHVIYNTFPVNGHAIKRSDLPVASLPAQDDDSGDAGNSTDASPANPPPMPQ